jgi:hypothetical protein
MANLGKREKIIIVVMGIVILYAALDFLMPKKKDFESNLNKKTEELNTFVQTLSEGLGKDASDKIGSFILARAEKEWSGDPFLDEKSFKAWFQEREQVKEVVEAPQVEFVYSGYVETDGNRMAIINGMEYKENEALDVKGYVLKSVSPTHATIENRRIRATIRVPLLE